jgi:hypothetical protein
LPPAFTGDRVVIDYRAGIPAAERLLVTGQPRREGLPADFELQRVVIDRVLEQNSAEVRWMFLICRLLQGKFGNRAQLEGVAGDVRDEAEAVWRAMEGTEPPIPRNAVITLPPA